MPRGIRVKVQDPGVVLEGTVHSWAEIDEAEDAAWLAPGVAKVDNRLRVS